LTNYKQYKKSTMSSKNELENPFSKESLEKRVQELRAEEQKAVNFLTNTERELHQIRGALILLQEQLQTFNKNG